MKFLNCNALRTNMLIVKETFYTYIIFVRLIKKYHNTIFTFDLDWVKKSGTFNNLKNNKK